MNIAKSPTMNSLHKFRLFLFLSISYILITLSFLIKDIRTEVNITTTSTSGTILYFGYSAIITNGINIISQMIFSTYFRLMIFYNNDHVITNRETTRLKWNRAFMSISGILVLMISIVTSIIGLRECMYRCYTALEFLAILPSYFFLSVLAVTIVMYIMLSCVSICLGNETYRKYVDGLDTCIESFFGWNTLKIYPQNDYAARDNIPDSNISIPSCNQNTKDSIKIEISRD